MSTMEPPAPLGFEQGRNCWQVGRASRAAVIVDADDYFAHLRAAMLAARERILMIGWDFDARIPLVRSALGPDDPPAGLGDLILWIAQKHPSVKTHILKWDVGSLKMLGRGTTLLTAMRWALHPRIQFKLDGAHPPGCSHHQKIVVVDDALAFCGGIDTTGDRWDTRAHLPSDPRRRRPNGRAYGPWHDITMAVDGEAAALLGRLGRDRWYRAGGQRLAPCALRRDLWPCGLDPQFNDLDLAISRTRADYQENGDVREIEAMVLDQIASARRFIYAENQYFTSRRIAEAIARRLAEPDPPEIFLVQPETADGWLEQQAMDGARVRLVRALRAKDPKHRFHLMVPYSADDLSIYVHAKLMIVDDLVLRVGSANMNNRSLALDSECDVTLRAEAAGDRVSQAILRLRAGLLAEHAGLNPALVEAQLAAGKPMHALLGTSARGGRCLRPLPTPPLGSVEQFVADHEILDPESPEALFERPARRRLFRKPRLITPRD
ncbi:MAG: phospholipase D-like domain-containing protein [Chakrabartia sp.]